MTIVSEPFTVIVPAVAAVAESPSTITKRDTRVFIGPPSKRACRVSFAAPLEHRLQLESEDVVRWIFRVRHRVLVYRRQLCIPRAEILDTPTDGRGGIAVLVDVRIILIQADEGA